MGVPKDGRKRRTLLAKKDQKAVAEKKGPETLQNNSWKIN
jgi:hypothetical protein